jgi:valyl-tRNA synthetase
MIADFPRYSAKFNYSACVKDIDLVKEIIKAIRNVKVTVGAAPSKKVKLYVKTEKAKPIKNGSIYIEKLAGVSEVCFIEDKNQLTEKLVSQVVSGVELYIPMGELVDVDKEIDRISKELEVMEREIARASGKLSNNGFLEKAPKSLVDSERAKLDKYIDMRDKLKNQLAELKK